MLAWKQEWISVFIESAKTRSSFRAANMIDENMNLKRRDWEWRRALGLWHIHVVDDDMWNFCCKLKPITCNSSPSWLDDLFKYMRIVQQTIKNHQWRCRRLVFSDDEYVMEATRIHTDIRGRVLKQIKHFLVNFWEYIKLSKFRLLILSNYKSQ